MQDLQLFNTLSRRLEPFRPLDPDCVRVYSCGPTVYSRQHLGNLRTYVFADLLRRVLQHFGYRVRHVINVTDVGHLSDDADQGEDKVERAARRGSTSAAALTEQVFAWFQRDLARLNVLSPHVWCKASEHIPQQLELIERLARRGLTYRLEDGIYFDTARAPHYGELSGLCATREHARVSAAGSKKNPADFALWKLSDPNAPRRQMQWPSPFGDGFPGWHIECSAMASHYLGSQFDIHTGGVDHIAVHHSNEIAQAEHGFGVRPWVRFWLHGAWLLEAGEKVSKSAGGAPSLDELEHWRVEPDAFRYYLLTAHYRAPLSLNRKALEAAQVAWRRLQRFAASEGEAGGEEQSTDTRDPELDEAFTRALATDLDAPRALTVIWRTVRERRLAPSQRRALVRYFALALGLTLRSEAEPPARDEAVDVRIEHLVRERERARERRDFRAADQARAELSALGVSVVDTPHGPRWSRS
jgi:cysteinyl-tRNA synthetase